MSPIVKAFFDARTCTFSYVVHAPGETDCAIIDPVLDYELSSGQIDTHSARSLVDYVRRAKLSVKWILETHAHADHLSSAQWLKSQLGGQVAIGNRITEVQRHFADKFNARDDMAVDGSQFDCLLADDTTLPLGTLTISVMHTPGHTPACVSYLIGDAVFVGDTLFMPDYGTARCDFPGGSARDLYASIQRLLALPPTTRLFMCHDYPPNGREPRYETSVAEERANNVLVHAGITEREFVTARQTRDAGLAAPVLLIPSIQVNIRAGHLPPGGLVN
jgi:glyoxylase-like metal-dependent hydrolase (beta-lactamase superfamily II)